MRRRASSRRRRRSVVAARSAAILAAGIVLVVQLAPEPGRAVGTSAPTGAPRRQGPVVPVVVGSTDASAVAAVLGAGAVAEVIYERRGGVESGIVVSSTPETGSEVSAEPVRLVAAGDPLAEDFTSDPALEARHDEVGRSVAEVVDRAPDTFIDVELDLTDGNFLVIALDPSADVDAVTRDVASAIGQRRAWRVRVCDHSKAALERVSDELASGSWRDPGASAGGTTSFRTSADTCSVNLLNDDVSEAERERLRQSFGPLVRFEPRTFREY